MKIELEQVEPAQIEKRSFEIISEELCSMGKIIPKEHLSIVKRVIHTTADFEYADNLRFSPGAVEKGLAALEKGALIVTDTSMAWSGINKRVAGALNTEVLNFIGDEDVAMKAKELRITRSAVCMEKAYQLSKESDRPVIIAVGNAPTALVALYELHERTGFTPALVIGVPVGFVNVVQAKELIMETEIPYIVAKGRKGGSNVAAAIVNALLYRQSEGTFR